MNKKQEIEKALKHFLKRKISINISTLTAFLIAGMIGFSVEARAVIDPVTQIENTNSKIGTINRMQSVKDPTYSSIIDGNYNIKEGTLSNSIIYKGTYESDGNYSRTKNTIIGADSFVRGTQEAVALGGQIYAGTNGDRNYQRNNMALGSNSIVGDGVTNINQGIAIGGGDIRRRETDLTVTIDRVKSGNTSGAWAKGDQSIAIGGNTVAYGHSSVAIGGDDLDRALTQPTTYTNQRGQVVILTFKMLLEI